MSQVVKPQAGTFCWPELSTSEIAAACTFYGGLLGWDLEKVPTGGFEYFVAKLDGKAAAALGELKPQEKELGIPPHWLSFIAVDSADATTSKVDGLGGTLLAGPFDVMDLGRMAVIADPEGAVFAIWETKTNPGLEISMVPGSLCWTELMAKSAEAATAFYTGLFGWSAQTSDEYGMPYTMFFAGETPAGGMMQMTEEFGDIPPHWMPYFAVTDAEATVAKAKELGGSCCVEPTDIPKIGRFAVLNDPQGASFSIIKMLDEA